MNGLNGIIEEWKDTQKDFEKVKETFRMEKEQSHDLIFQYRILLIGIGLGVSGSFIVDALNNLIFCYLNSKSCLDSVQQFWIIEIIFFGGIFSASYYLIEKEMKKHEKNLISMYGIESSHARLEQAMERMIKNEKASTHNNFSYKTSNKPDSKQP